MKIRYVGFILMLFVLIPFSGSPKGCDTNPDSLVTKSEKAARAVTHEEVVINYPDSSQSNGPNYWWSIVINALLTIGSIGLTWLSLKKQIRATKENILQSFNLEQSKLLLENVSNLIVEIRKCSGDNFRYHKYHSEKHLLYDIRIRLMLDPSKDEGLINCLERFSQDENLNVEEWIIEIIEKVQCIINNKRK